MGRNYTVVVIYKITEVFERLTVNYIFVSITLIVYIETFFLTGVIRID